MSVHATEPIAVTVRILVDSARHKEARLLAGLQIVEARLGTDAERAGDLELAREIAHRLVSIACVYALADSFPQANPTPAS